MDGDLNDLAGLFQEEADVAALSALWSFLEPADRLAVLAVSWYLSTGFHRFANSAGCSWTFSMSFFFR